MLGRLRDRTITDDGTIDQARAGSLTVKDPAIVVWWGTEMECASAIARLDLRHDGRGINLTDGVRYDNGDNNGVFQGAGRDPAASARKTSLDVRRSPSDQRNGRRPGLVAHQASSALRGSGWMAIPARLR